MTKQEFTHPIAVDSVETVRDTCGQRYMQGCVPVVGLRIYVDRWMIEKKR